MDHSRVMLEVKKQELSAIQILNDQTNNHSLVYYIIYSDFCPEANRKFVG